MKNAMQLKARINALAKRSGIPAQAVMQQYMMERVLERIAMSEWRDRFIFKGGMLLASMIGIGARTTMDMDTTLKNFPLDPVVLSDGLMTVFQLDAGDDVTLEFLGMEPIRADDEYGGYRAMIVACCYGTRTSISIDITTGDLITPAEIVH